MEVKIKEKFSSRKLAVTAILYITSTVALFTGFCEFDGWSTFNKWIFGIYAAGNVGEHFKDKLGKK